MSYFDFLKDFDAISPRSTRKTAADDINTDSCQPSHSPSSDTSSSTSNIYIDAQESIIMTNSIDSTCHSHLVNKLPSAATQTDEV